MDYLALYRKYRPKELNEVVGQNDIKKILSSSIVTGTITHAYLFSGPRGTGKTTMAKILAKMVNCKNPVDGNPCGKCEFCLNVLNSNDVIEIDAASNNGVDEIRDLREKANLVPSFAKYKVYIIDEVHMLTTQAFNALLKTLEEPPKHVIFILATTEYYKIPLTITSRCQKFQFNKIMPDDIVTRLKEISDNENIKIDDNALYEIAKISDGGMRDSINLLDQLRSFNSDVITINDVYNVCGNVDIEDLVNLFKNIYFENVESIISFFENLDKLGKNYIKFNDDVIEFLKDIILFKKNVNYKFIKSSIDGVKQISEIYSENEIFEMLEFINNLVDKLKYVSRQSVYILSNYLLLTYKIKNGKLNTNSSVENDLNLINNINNSGNNDYDNAFNFTQNSSDTVISNVVNEVNAMSNENNFDDNVYFANRDIIVNNAFAVANKKFKNNVMSKISDVSTYLTDKKYMNAASILLDTKLEVAGENYLILSCLNDAIVDKFYKNYKLCVDLLNDIFNLDFYVAVINANEWDNYRNEYVKKISLGENYQLKELTIIEKKLFDDQNDKNNMNIVDKLFDLVGEDSVEFK